MKTTKEEIMMVALNMFAERGFDAVSTSMIAGEIGITKGALYRHYDSKQAIFDSIIDKMYQLDEDRAVEDHVPAEAYSDNPESYTETELGDFCDFAINQFAFWTEHEFASAFRRMITLEQYRNPEMNKLYQDVICRGPVDYSADIFKEMINRGELNENARKYGAENLAVELFAPLKLMIEMSDGGIDNNSLKLRLKDVIGEFKRRWTK